MWQKLHCVFTLCSYICNYIITNCIVQYPYCNGKLEKPQRTISLCCKTTFQTNCQITTPMLIKSIGTTLGQYVFECNLATWDIIQYTGFTAFHMFFLTQLNCLHNFQVDILSNKERILRRCTLKELRSKLVTMLKMCCYRCFSRRLAKIYRTAFLSNFLMYVKRNPVEQSLGGVFNPLMLVVLKGHIYLYTETNLEVLVEGLFNMYDKKETGIEHANLVIYLER